MGRARFDGLGEKNEMVRWYILELSFMQLAHKWSSMRKTSTGAESFTDSAFQLAKDSRKQ